MADTITTSSQLKIDNYFVDGDTRIITLKNPKNNITTSQIEDLQSFLRTTNALIGDKVGGTFGKISSVKRITETRTQMDFTT